MLEEAFLQKSIPDQLLSGPFEKEAPPIAVVMSDGGRYQVFDRGNQSKGDFWRESRIATLLSMTGTKHSCDPQPDLPDFLQDVCIAKKLSQIGKVAGENATDTDSTDDHDSAWDRGEMLSKEVIASGETWEEFGPMVASRAWYEGFAKAAEKVFVSDGSRTIEKMQERWFSDYVSVLDIMHALSYSLAAARALHSDNDQSWTCYRHWATLIWQGKVREVIAEMDSSQLEIGDPPKDAKETDRREILRRSRVYYSNHAGRMDYPNYRQNGYPLSSAIMESTVKQVGKRVKGTEKFWSSEGGEAILQLRGDYLSDSQPMDAYWKQAIANAEGCRAYGLST